ncbi:MAG: hypothetical protein WCJ18_11560, partial [Planctomycetota bacterium]
MTREWLKQNAGDAVTVAGKGRVAVEHLGPRGTEHQERPRSGTRARVAHEVKKALVRPVKILEHEDQRADVRQTLDEPQPRRVILLGAG